VRLLVLIGHLPIAAEKGGEETLICKEFEMKGRNEGWGERWGAIVCFAMRRRKSTKFNQKFNLRRNVLTIKPHVMHLIPEVAADPA